MVPSYVCGGTCEAEVSPSLLFLDYQHGIRMIIWTDWTHQEMLTSNCDSFGGCGSTVLLKRTVADHVCFAVILVQAVRDVTRR